MQEGDKHSKNEAWEEAVAAYQGALALDTSYYVVQKAQVESQKTE